MSSEALRGKHPTLGGRPGHQMQKSASLIPAMSWSWGVACYAVYVVYLIKLLRRSFKIEARAKRARIAPTSGS